MTLNHQTAPSKNFRTRERDYLPLDGHNTETVRQRTPASKWALHDARPSNDTGEIQIVGNHLLDFGLWQSQSLDRSTSVIHELVSVIMSRSRRKSGQVRFLCACKAHVLCELLDNQSIQRTVWARVRALINPGSHLCSDAFCLLGLGDRVDEGCSIDWG